MNSMLIRCRSLRPASSSRIWRWIVTSSAVVGSSAIKQLGLAGERHRDHDALLLAARELVRIRRQSPLRLGHADFGEQRLGARGRLAPAQAEVLHQRLGDLLADREHRVERAHRVLEHAGDLASAQRLQLGEARGEQVATLEA